MLDLFEFSKGICKWPCNWNWRN